ncbi:MAG TPA: enoyl-CoA hydratase-related protein [Pseudonocardia sp.]|jgi:enoyl-CoA hydratase
MTESMSRPSVISWQSAGGVRTVRLSNPPANALGQALIGELAEALDSFEQSTDQVLLFASELPGFFAAGADIKLMSGASAAEFAGYGEALRGTLNRIAASSRPSIAVIEGRALGGGLELAMAATLRVGSRTARLGLPESKLGLIPGAGGTARLPRLVGRGRALDIMLTGREVDAEEAHRIGLLDRLTEPGGAEAEALALAAVLRANSPAALSEVIRCVDDADDLALDQALQREADRVNTLFSGPQAQEGLRAFLAKRRPDFTTTTTRESP